MPSAIKIVVFDLDGTLADTAKLGTNRRMPSDILEYSPPNSKQNIFIFDPSLKWKLSYLIQCGIHVYIITRAPKAYASTLVHLLGIDFCGLIPSDAQFPSDPEFKGIPKKLETISMLESAHKSEMLYVGDLSHDKRAAEKFGCHFQYPPWFSSAAEENDLLTPIFEEAGAIANEERNGDEKLEYISAYEKTKANYDTLGNSDSTEWILSGSSLINSRSKIVWDNFFCIPKSEFLLLKPFINPHILTRFKYETEQFLLIKLFEILKEIGFGPKEIYGPYADPGSDFSNSEKYANFSFQDSQWGSPLWNLIKDWNLYKGGSGPNNFLHYLEIVALGMACGMFDAEEPTLIVPIPSSIFSKMKPGQVSERLAIRISELTEIPVLNLLSKNESGLFMANEGSYPLSKIIYLVDDQLTGGDNAKKSLALLRGIGVNPREVKIFCWTSSKFKPIL